MADDLETQVQAFIGRSYGPYRAWDEVNAPMIRQWREAIHAENDDRSAPTDVAPRTMLNVWMMRGLANGRPEDSVTDDPLGVAQPLRDAGYIGVVATRCKQSYVRNLKAGERLESHVTVSSVSARKTTHLGEGYFVTLRHDYSVAGEPVGAMDFTTLHYKPKAKPNSRPAPPQPGISDDTRFFWDGVAQNRLLVQECADCHAVRHPPGPVCTHCHSFDWNPLEVQGKGKLHSWTVVHHAAHDAFDYPHTIGLIDLDAGLRMIAPLELGGVEPREGLPLEIVYRHVEGEDRLPAFRPAGEA